MKNVMVSLVLAFTLLGCATIERGATQETEQLPAAAGFRMKLADTPGKLANLQALPQQRLTARMMNGKVIYLYADAAVCNCLYMGNEKAYQRYQQFAVEKQIAAEQADAAQMDMGVDWSMWGPWGDPYF
jgi:hypothetical protein